jgi:glycosyltransferase involved in cell wall biosynthesis
MVFRYVLSNQVKNAKHIITPTQYVKDQLGEIYGSQIKEKTKCLYEGVNYEFIDVKENGALIKQFPTSFLLYVGNFFPHKNVERLLNAYKLLQTDVPLVLLGPDNLFASELKKKIAREQISNVNFYHSSTIEDIIFFYKHARALINPSLSEGFGLPLIEAAYYQVPIIASNLEVFKELFGDEYIAFNPHSEGDIKEKIEDFLKNPVTYQFSRLSVFSFEKMTDDEFNAYCLRQSVYSTNTWNNLSPEEKSVRIENVDVSVRKIVYDKNSKN